MHGQDLIPTLVTPTANSLVRGVNVSGLSDSAGAVNVVASAPVGKDNILLWWLSHFCLIVCRCTGPGSISYRSGGQQSPSLFPGLAKSPFPSFRTILRRFAVPTTF